MSRTRLLAVSACICAVASLISCSSAPAPTDAVFRVKNQAAQDSTSGEGYYRQARYDLALQFFTQALNGYTSIDDTEGVATCCNLIGKTYLVTGSFDQAETMFSRARGKAHGVSPSLVLDATNSLGELYLARGDAPKALATFQEALALPPAAQTPARTALLYHNMGTAEKNLSHLSAALEYYQKSLQINLSNKLNAEAASDYYMIASVHSKQGRFDEALKNADVALALDKRVENSPGIAEDLYALGLISTRRKDPAAAFDFYQRSYSVYATMGLKPGLKKTLTGLISAADELGRKADADEYRKALADLETQ
jgi:tetratricopeptide (TPR) repeat protein